MAVHEAVQRLTLSPTLMETSLEMHWYVENDRRIEAAEATLEAKLAATQHRPIRRGRVFVLYL